MTTPTVLNRRTSTRQRVTIGVVTLAAAGALVLAGSVAAGTSSPAVKTTTAAAVAPAVVTLAVPHDPYYDVIGAPGWGYQASCDTGIRGVSTKTGALLDGGEFTAFGLAAPKTTYSGTFRKGVLILAAAWCADISPKLMLQTLVAPAGYTAPVEQLPISIVGNNSAGQILGLTPSTDVHAQYLITLGVTKKGVPVDSTVSSASSPVQPRHRYGTTSGIADPDHLVGYSGPAAFITYASGSEAADGVTETLQSSDASGAAVKDIAAITLKNSLAGSKDLPIVTVAGKTLPVVAYRDSDTAYPRTPDSSYAAVTLAAGGVLTSVTVNLQ